MKIDAGTGNGAGTATVAPPPAGAPPADGAAQVLEGAGAGGNGNGAAPAPTEADARLARAYHDLQRRDRELRKREGKLGEVTKDAEAYRRIKELSAKDRVAAVREFGMDPLGLAGDVLGTTEPPKEPEPVSPEVQRLLARIEELDAKLQTREQQEAEERTKRAREAQLGTLAEKIVAVGDGGELLGYLAQNGGQAFVEQLQAAYDREAEEYGEPPDHADFLRRAAEHVNESYCTAIEGILKSVPFVRDKVASILGATAQQTETEPAKPSTKPKPISTSQRQTGGDVRSVPLSNLPRAERLRAVIAKAETMRPKM